jgi:phospholipase/carboxylesterase
MSPALLDCIEVSPKAAPEASVIWLHGLGADGHDFEPVVSELPLTRMPPTRFVFAHAPHRPVTINGGFVMRAWYDIVASDLGRAVDLKGVEGSTREIERLIDREVELGIPPTRIVIAGFSQGGVIALEAASAYRARLAGVMALSTYLARPDAFPPSVDGLPIFLAHGTQDPIVPYRSGEQARAELEGKGYAVTWRTYPMPHSVCAQEIADIGAWLVATLAPSSGS